MITNSPMPHSTAFALSLATAILGWLPLLIAIYKYRRTAQLLATGLQATGFIEELHTRRGLKGATYYDTLVDFPAASGRQRHYYTFSARKYKTILAKGNTVTVTYDPRKPKRFAIKEIPLTKTLIIFTTIFAVIYLVLAFFLYDFMVR